MKGRSVTKKLDHNKLYQYDLEEQNQRLIYTANDAYWVNELSVSSNAVYWVEYINHEQGVTYKIMQYELDNGFAQCIASREADEFGEICLSASNHYVTWYDSYLDGRVNAVIYDVRTQQTQVLQDETIVKYMPYERLDIVDEGITFLSADAEHNIYVNRYSLFNGEKITYQISQVNEDSSIAGCFSNSYYIGWFANYGGPFYFYDIAKGTICILDSDFEKRIFSLGLKNKYAYINIGDEIYVCDLENHEMTQCQTINGRGLQFSRIDDGTLFMEASTDREMIVYQIR